MVPSGEGPLTEPATPTVICAEPDIPPESRTDAVIVCVPDESARTTVDPYPSKPSMLDVHASDPDMSPSCLSVAEPENVTAAPLLNEEPGEGEEMATLGAVFLLVDVGG
jgi:hypothetical protein